jgi:AraC-like DNA-binding protein
LNLIQLRKKLHEKFQKEAPKPASTDLLTGMPLREKQFLKRLDEMIDMHLAEDEYSVEELSRDMAMSRMQLHRKLKALTDTSASLYIRSIRLDRGKQMLDEGLYNVSEVAYRVGFNSPTYFSTCFSERFGFPPSEIKLFK